MWAIQTFFLKGGVLKSVVLGGRIALETPAGHWLALGSFSVCWPQHGCERWGARGEGGLDSVQGHRAIVGKRQLIKEGHAAVGRI